MALPCGRSPRCFQLGQLLAPKHEHVEEEKVKQERLEAEKQLAEIQRKERLEKDIKTLLAKC